ncbi:MAG: hypothetical protein D6696_13395 [Acidobacteria bacterium]|nr:MAG: hypothetical protein D6696_13395 [Acidobacteriota bacterium]
MSKNDSAPTMIIPSGTEIQIDVHGQLSVRTPGNLVIQNSGHYGEIESVGGSIRIEANAEVEAVSLRCAETCYVQGSLTAWRVKARAIHLEDSAQARIVLQETEAIDIGKNAQLVGNFSSEKELFLLFSRFAQQLRSLPFYFDRGTPPPAQLEQPPAAEEPAPEDDRRDDASGSGTVRVAPLTSRVLEEGRELPDELFFALVLLERETKNDSYGATSIRVLEELVKLLKERDLETLRHTHRTLLGRIVEPGPDVRRAHELIERAFRQPDAEAVAG